MTKKFNILLSDRNHNIREFLRRELVKEGYRVDEAKDAWEILKLVLAEKPPDLLILDPELPYVSGLGIFEKLELRKPSLPVVIHTFDIEEAKSLPLKFTVAIVEKKGNNIDRIKSVIADLLKKS